MDLYCDTPECPTGNTTYNRVTYTGRTESQCLREAKEQGWKFTKERKSYCPKCNRKGGRK